MSTTERKRKPHPWSEKYRPQSLVDVVGDSDVLRTFHDMVETRSVPHTLLYGPPGTGKSSMIQALGRDLYGPHYRRRVVYYNASDDRGIGAVREKISPVAKRSVSPLPLEGGGKTPPFQIIVLDEADAMTYEGQDALRVIIEKYSHVTRFCFICNYIDQITDAIKSRCTHIFFPPLPSYKVAQRLAYVGGEEGMRVEEEIYQAICRVCRGDMRRAVVLLQQVADLERYRQLFTRPYLSLTEAETQILFYASSHDGQVKVEDIYRMGGVPSPEESGGVVKKIIRAESLGELVPILKSVVSSGRSNDEVIMALYEIILHLKLPQEIKRECFLHASSIISNINSGSDSFLQIMRLAGYLRGHRVNL